MMRLGLVLESYGHKCSFIIPKYGEAKCTKMLRERGFKGDIHYPDDMTRDVYAHGDNWPQSNDWFAGNYKMIDICRKTIEEMKPDLTICDVMSFFAAFPSDDLGIPVIVYVAHPIDNFMDFSRQAFPTRNNSCSCCGFFCWYHKPLSLGMDIGGASLFFRK